MTEPGARAGDVWDRSPSSADHTDAPVEAFSADRTPSPLTTYSRPLAPTTGPLPPAWKVQLVATLGDNERGATHRTTTLDHPRQSIHQQRAAPSVPTAMHVANPPSTHLDWDAGPTTVDEDDV
jgi:hypothetical protein